jgi:hypothetical protein
MFRPDDVRQIVREKEADRERRQTRRTPEGEEANRKAARERYQRMSPEERSNYNDRCSERRSARATNREDR